MAMRGMNRTGAWRVWALVAVGCLGAAMLTQRVARAEGVEKTKEAKVDTALIERRLKELLETQQQILQRLDAMAEELQVIKVRCTR